MAKATDSPPPADPPAPPVETAPPVSHAGKCPNCDEPTKGSPFCPGCGCQLSKTGARDTDLDARVAKLENDLGPVGAFFARLKSRGIDPAGLKDEHLDMAKGMLGGSGGGGFDPMKLLFGRFPPSG